ncbi:hypothetical protein BV25DRAFT_504203 [Artomyces pyxidatus]|uniref:Uncharacterized protein n=1 Tax=Artomyces pyxidatus TaxID=48021 RepID=A0ACB8THZ2_9AGAM|nr:hypothetical protein BV25DRAFT_504203 [Artomyces pyxidatus]
MRRGGRRHAPRIRDFRVRARARQCANYPREPLAHAGKQAAQRPAQRVRADRREHHVEIPLPRRASPPSLLTPRANTAAGRSATARADPHAALRRPPRPCIPAAAPSTSARARAAPARAGPQRRVHGARRRRPRRARAAARRRGRPRDRRRARAHAPPPALARRWLQSQSQSQSRSHSSPLGPPRRVPLRVLVLFVIIVVVPQRRRGRHGRARLGARARHRDRAPRGGECAPARGAGHLARGARGRGHRRRRRRAGAGAAQCAAVRQRRVEAAAASAAPATGRTRSRDGAVGPGDGRGWRWRDDHYRRDGGRCGRRPGARDAVWGAGAECRMVGRCVLMIFFLCAERVLGRRRL